VADKNFTCQVGHRESTMSEHELLHTSRFSVVELPSPASGRLRQVIRHPGSVVIIPMVDEDHVCLIRNFRISVGRTLVELPAGTREPGEAAEETAARELAEETGYRAKSLERLTHFLPAPGILDEQMILYLARGLSEGLPAREAGEEIENLVVPWQEAVAMVKRGEIEDAKTIIGLLLWEPQGSGDG
jgi:ADP-ribose pyrophosphatase